jgi:hypothetical protein
MHPLAEAGERGHHRGQVLAAGDDDAQAAVVVVVSDDPPERVEREPRDAFVAAGMQCIPAS